MALIAIGNVTHMDFCALFNILSQSTAAGDLQIIGMAADCKNFHMYFSFS
jgi:hypothetical protein